MLKVQKVFLPFVLMVIFCAGQSFALESALSDFAHSAGEVVKSVGQQVGIGVKDAKIDSDVSLALKELLKKSATARKMEKKARAILVFPKIMKAGLGLGGYYGEGALLSGGKTVGYYATAAGSYGLQIGAQSFGYAMFFMDDRGLDYLLQHNEGWEVGVGPSVVFLDEGMATTMSNTTVSESVYVFTFNQRGLMAGAGIQGSKITPKGSASSSAQK